MSATARRTLGGAIITLLVMALLPLGAAANGGTIRLASTPAGPYAITVYTSPSPLRVGPIDVSVLVQRAGGQGNVEDARVEVVLTPLDGSAPAGRGQAFLATREQATNKLFYAAHIELPISGRWRVETRVRGTAGEGAAAFEVDTTGAASFERIGPLVALTAGGTIGLWLIARLIVRRRARPAGAR